MASRVCLNLGQQFISAQAPDCKDVAYQSDPQINSQTEIALPGHSFIKAEGIFTLYLSSPKTQLQKFT
jgi:hypothetical protein